MIILGNIKSFHSAKFRFTFTHVFIHASLNLKIKPSISRFGFTIPFIYIRTSKLKPKLMALNSIHFSFSRNKYLVTGCGYCLNLY